MNGVAVGRISAVSPKVPSAGHHGKLVFDVMSWIRTSLIEVFIERTVPQTLDCETSDLRCNAALKPADGSRVVNRIIARRETESSGLSESCGNTF